MDVGGARQSRGHVSLSRVHKAPEGRAERQASLGGRKPIPTAWGAWVGSDLPVSGSMRVEAGGFAVGICILGVRLLVSSSFLSGCVPSTSVGLVNIFWPLGPGRAGMEVQLCQAPPPTASHLDSPYLLTQSDSSC